MCVSSIKCLHLSLNAKKTNFIVFYSVQKKYDASKITINLNANKIEQIGQQNSSESISTNGLIKQIRSKVLKNIGVLWKLKAYLTSKLLLMVYNSLILPYFTYCNLKWSNVFESRLDKLVVLQKKDIRIIGKAEYLAHADP